MPPDVDILMPVRDGAATLPAALDSIAAQTGAVWRLIAVDDGSTDTTADLLRAFADRHPGQVVVIAHPGHGLVGALNAGLCAVRAPMVARMDADDRMHPERLARQCAYLEAHPGIGLVASRVTYEGSGPGFRRYVDWSNTLVEPEAIARNRFVESPLVHPSVCFRKEVADRFGGYGDGDFPEDYDLWLRWMEAGVRMAKLPEPLLTWRDAPGRLTRTDSRYRVDAFYRVKCHYLASDLRRRRGRDGAVWLWGAGTTTRRRFRFLWREGIPLRGWIDIDPAKIGRRYLDREVVTPERAEIRPGDVVVLGVGTRGARDIMSGWLEDRGYRAGVEYICAA